MNQFFSLVGSVFTPESQATLWVVVGLVGWLLLGLPVGLWSQLNCRKKFTKEDSWGLRLVAWVIAGWAGLAGPIGSVFLLIRWIRRKSEGKQALQLAAAVAHLKSSPIEKSD